MTVLVFFITFAVAVAALSVLPYIQPRVVQVVPTTSDQHRQWYQVTTRKYWRNTTWLSTDDYGTARHMVTNDPCAHIPTKLAIDNAISYYRRTNDSRN